MQRSHPKQIVKKILKRCTIFPSRKEHQDLRKWWEVEYHLDNVLEISVLLFPWSSFTWTRHNSCRWAAAGCGRVEEAGKKSSDNQGWCIYLYREYIACSFHHRKPPMKYDEESVLKRRHIMGRGIRGTGKQAPNGSSFFIQHLGPSQR